MIEHAQGNNRDARRYLEQALTLNPHFHVFYADQARRTLDSIDREPPRMVQVRAAAEAADAAR